jgi:hypothetical protein
VSSPSSRPGSIQGLQQLTAVSSSDYESQWGAVEQTQPPAVAAAAAAAAAASAGVCGTDDHLGSPLMQQSTAGDLALLEPADSDAAVAQSGSGPGSSSSGSSNTCTATTTTTSSTSSSSNSTHSAPGIVPFEGPVPAGNGLPQADTSSATMQVEAALGLQLGTEVMPGGVAGSAVLPVLAAVRSLQLEARVAAAAVAGLDSEPEIGASPAGSVSSSSSSSSSNMRTGAIREGTDSRTSSMVQDLGLPPSSTAESGLWGVDVEVVLPGGSKGSQHKHWHTGVLTAAASFVDGREGGTGQRCRSTRGMPSRLSSGLVGWPHRAAAATAVLLEALVGG